MTQFSFTMYPNGYQMIVIKICVIYDSFWLPICPQVCPQIYLPHCVRFIKGSLHINPVHYIKIMLY